MRAGGAGAARTIKWLQRIKRQEAGWWLRSEVIWHKPNVHPESVLDRPTKAHETIFLLSKAKDYHYDIEAVRGPSSLSDLSRESK